MADFFTVRIKSRVSSAHQLRGYDGMCERIHGHNWVIEAEISGERLNDIGILVDFIDLQNLLDKKVAELDHINMNEHEWFLKENATSENMAKRFYRYLKDALKDEGVRVEEVSVWETEDYRATYREK